jgi:hypothetical protein
VDVGPDHALSLRQGHARARGGAFPAAGGCRHGLLVFPGPTAGAARRRLAGQDGRSTDGAGVQPGRQPGGPARRCDDGHVNAVAHHFGAGAARRRARARCVSQKSPAGCARPLHPSSLQRRAWQRVGRPATTSHSRQQPPSAQRCTWGVMATVSPRCGPSRSPARPRGGSGRGHHRG